jgi:hypothetical protein
LAYIDKGIEVVLVGFLVFEVWLIDGGPVEVVRRIARLLAVLGAAVTGRGRT